MKPEGDYVLGTHDEEIERLGLQHRVWRPSVLSAWAKAGITEGSRVLDLGCGPGHATIDLAEIVGRTGSVLGLERSARFLEFGRGACRERGLANVTFREADLMSEVEIERDFDFVWCRWVACFLPDLAPLTRHLRSALRPGGTAIFHEYIDYATWQGIPRCAGIEKFAARFMSNWRASGGEPDIAAALIPRLITAGFQISETRPLIFAVSPRDFMWRWPSSFIKSHLKRMLENGQAE